VKQKKQILLKHHIRSKKSPKFSKIPACYLKKPHKTITHDEILIDRKDDFSYTYPLSSPTSKGKAG